MSHRRLVKDFAEESGFPTQCLMKSLCAGVCSGGDDSSASGDIGPIAPVFDDVSDHQTGFRVENAMIGDCVFKIISTVGGFKFLNKRSQRNSANKQTA